MLAIARKFWQRCRGASMVEFAIVLPVLLLLVAGLWEFGRIYDSYLVATNAAREGARWAALGKSPSEVQSRVNEYLDAGYASRLSTGELTVGTITMTLLDDSLDHSEIGHMGAPVEVRVPVTVAFFIPGILNLGSNITLTGQATMSLQQASQGG